MFSSELSESSDMSKILSFFSDKIRMCSDKKTSVLKEILDCSDEKQQLLDEFLAPKSCRLALGISKFEAETVKAQHISVGRFLVHQ